VTDWALAHFREHYGDESIGKWDIFYYVYGVLHHPGYREKFADNLKRELPRIPLAPPLANPNPERERGPDQSRDREGAVSRSGPVAGAPGSDQRPTPNQSRDRERAVSHTRPREGAGRYKQPVQSPGATDQPDRKPSASGFWAFADAGRKLADLHIGYEALEPWPLEWVETPGEPLSCRVEKMRLSKDKKSLKVNDSLTLGGIPPEVFDYRLGNRSTLEWVIDQYRIKEDQRSAIRSDPNNPDDPEYIVRLVGQVVRVSVETVGIVRDLPEDYAPPANSGS
jgi:predicted helicase